MNHSEEDSSTPNQSIKNMLDPNKERKLIKVDFSALARLVVRLYIIVLHIFLLFSCVILSRIKFVEFRF